MYCMVCGSVCVCGIVNSSVCDCTHHTYHQATGLAGSSCENYMEAATSDSRGIYKLRGLAEHGHTHWVVWGRTRAHTGT